MRKRRNLKNVNQFVRLFCSKSFGGMLRDLLVEEAKWAKGIRKVT